MQKGKQDEQIRPKRIKKGKKFANSDFMLSLIDDVNRGLEGRIQASLEKEAEVIKVMAIREKKKVAKKEAKGRHLQSVKEKLRQNSKGKGKDGRNEKGGKSKEDEPSSSGKNDGGKKKDKKVRFK